MSHGNNTYPTYNYMVNYRQYPPKYNKEECGSLGIVSDTMMNRQQTCPVAANGWACKPGKAKNYLC